MAAEEVAFLAAKECIAALCGEAQRLRMADSPADRARSAQCLKSAAALRTLLRDRMLCVPACEAAGERVAAWDQSQPAMRDSRARDADAGGGGHAGGGSASGGGSSSGDSGPAGDDADADRDCRPSGAARRARAQHQAAVRRQQQRARAAERLLEALAGWHAGQEAWLLQLLATQPVPGPGERAEPLATAGGGPTTPAPAPLPDARQLARGHAQSRRAALQAELSACSAAAAACSMPRARLEQLLAAVRHLRAAEGGLAFHSRLARAAAAAADKAGYADDASFAYGSTPFSSWLQVYGDPAVALAMAKVMGFAAGCSPQPQAERRDGAPGGGSAAAAEAPGQQRRYMVWGSSAGWLVLYGAAAKGWRLCTGVELLPCLVQEARTAAARLGYEGVSFECGDLLASSLGDVGVLQATEQCWDPELIRKAAAKIDAELAPGAVVVDYTGALVSRLARGSLLVVEAVATSWGEVSMHVCVMGPEQ